MSRANENIIQAAIEGFEAQKQRLDEQIAPRVPALAVLVMGAVAFMFCLVQ